MLSKCIPRDALAAACRRLRAEGKRLVFTNGCFDLLHPGHIRLISSAAELGDRLIVAINDDGGVRRLKGKQRPIYPAAERAELLLALRWVDLVTVFPEDTPLKTIELARPDVLVKGGEYEEKDIVGATLVRGYGGDVARIPMKPGHATRLILERMARESDG